jgi:GTP-binding protein
MKINTIEFEKSSANLEQCPKPNKIEYAFVGRSNVGKSSLINMLTDRKKIALTSGNPGKTRLINHFLVNEEWYLVDLPGYGYAKVSKKDRATFDILIRSYLQKRENLSCLFFLIDCRHSPINSDMEFLRWLGENQIPFVIVFTKADKLSENQLREAIEKYKEHLLTEWEELPQTFVTSATKGLGKEDVLGFIESTNGILNKNKFL